MTYSFCSYDVCTSDFLRVNILSLRRLSGNGWRAETVWVLESFLFHECVSLAESVQCGVCVCVRVSEWVSHWLLGSSGARFITLLTAGWWRCLKRLSSFLLSFCFSFTAFIFTTHLLLIAISQWLRNTNIENDRGARHRWSPVFPSVSSYCPSGIHWT